MMGLAYFMLNQSKKMLNIARKTPSALMYVLGHQCLMVWPLVDKEGVGVCFHFSYEEPLHSAVMLVPIMLRKYGFHFILSGDLYNKWDQSNGAMDPEVLKEFVSVHEEVFTP
ncbi:unnamed protein product [Lactuca saligna]|uniref:Uncharacterized protein n=1 Tax=Lactuca saligna TaxID=75948 RepID=A0AA35ZP82_LACSI|nr:unnamed protein product [Lactuca saligna]